MNKTGIILGSLAMSLSLCVSYPAMSQDIDFGDDAGRWANDGQCDDPRFEGPGASLVRVAADEGHDATDCSTAFEAGTVTLAGTSAAAAPSANASDPSEIDFGDDSGTWANDGECDDPRFGGSLDSHLRADATDCRTAFEAGDVSYDASYGDTSSPVDAADIDFGDDSGSWANDGECDDPRFGGTLTSHEFADATDCRAAYDADPSIYVGNGTNTATNTGDIDFGDDSGTWANDGECDDPRFGGGLDTHILADATDCRAAYDADPSIYVGDSNVTIDGIDFGNDSGNWANDGECDDPRFGGSLDSHLRADASDCVAAYQADPSIYTGDAGSTGVTVDGIDFGDDSGSWANDGECDDPRFGGGLQNHLRADATDCQAAYALDPSIYLGDGADPDASGIDFGNDSGNWANDGECDDPRFGGYLDDHIRADATDCRAAYSINPDIYVGETGGTSSDFRINFGDDSGSAPFDGECDDPRFQGRGAAMELFESNILGDATDCRAAYDAGTVTYVP